MSGETLQFSGGSLVFYSNEPGPPGKPATQGVACYIPGPLLNDGTAVFLIPVLDTVGISRAVGRARLAAAANFVLPLQYIDTTGNVVTFGSLAWAAGATLAVATVSPVTLTAGMSLYSQPVTAPDVTLADFGVSFAS